MKSNPADDVKRIREPKADVDPLSLNEIELALANIDPHFRPLFTCLAWTGARPNELLALRWGCIDWRRKQIQIKLGRVRGKEGLPKSSASERIIPALPPVMAALEELKAREVQS
jgi:integrase